MGFSVIFPYLLSPFPEEIVKSYLKKAKKIFTIELNSLGQYAQFLKRYGIFAKPILKYTGRPFFIEELEEEIKKEI
jgi:pyruvate/2-oxoacid:ferredoxin oxidoreductase alpha subunit